MILVTDWNPGWGSIPQAIRGEGDEKLKSKLGKSKQDSPASKMRKYQLVQENFILNRHLVLVHKIAQALEGYQELLQMTKGFVHH